MARIKHYNPATQQWEYSDISSIQQGSNPELESHIINKSNPHEVTAEQIGAATTTYVDSLTKIYAQSSEPINPKDGDIWIDIDDNSTNEIDAILKTNIITDATSGDKSRTFIASASNSEYRYVYASGITSLALNAAGTFTNADEAYYSVVFISGTTATTITNTFNAYFSGDDCVEGVFTPAASKTYDLGIWWNGVKWQVAVRGSV